MSHMNGVNGQVDTQQRVSKSRRCIICGGAPSDPRGKGRRCAGYISSDGGYAHCMREEHAGGIAITENSQTYAHRLRGDCACGTVHCTDENEWRDVEAAYDYRDEAGRLLFQVVRKAGKQFLQRRPDGSGRWEWRLADTRRVLYRLPELIASDPRAPVYIVEGEKDVESLRERGLVATCNPGGAKKWSVVNDCARVALRGRDVTIIPDADKVGREHADQVRASIVSFVASLRTITLPGPSKDVSDWLAAGGTAEELEQLRRAARPNMAPDHAEHPDDASAADRDEEAPPKPDPFEAELAQALADVKAALGSSKKSKRAPLFDVDAAHLLGAEFADSPWLVTGLVTRGGVAMIGGEPKAAKKTWLATEIAIAIATGTKVCAEFYAQHGRVAYFYAEDAGKQIRNRMRALLAGAGRKLALDRLRLCPRGKFLDILQDEDLAWVVASARRLGTIDLLVLDPLSDVHSGEEDKRDSMKGVMQRLRLLGELLGCTVATVHHMGKQTQDSAKRGGGQRMRGSSVIHGSTDSGIYFVATGGDGSNHFVNVVESEVKGARSAGRFALVLDIEDDANGEAIRAWWSKRTSSSENTPEKPANEQKPVETQAAKDRRLRKEIDDRERASRRDTAFAFVRDLLARGERHTRTGLRKHEARPMGERPLVSSIDELLEMKRLVLEPDTCFVVLPEPPRARTEAES